MNNRLGEERYNNQGCLMKIIKYHNHSNIEIEFQDENKYRCKRTYSSFISGSIKNVYHPSACGVGYMGDGRHKSIINGKKNC